MERQKDDRRSRVGPVTGERILLCVISPFPALSGVVFCPGQICQSSHEHKFLSPTDYFHYFSNSVEKQFTSYKLYVGLDCLGHLRISVNFPIGSPFLMYG